MELLKIEGYQAHISAPLDTPFGRLFNVSEINKILSLECLSSLDEATYNEKLLPNMIGYQLPFDLFKRNISVVVNQVHK
ncbi:MAG: hypothetical protein ACERKZ_19775 [Lachnotalea sp.]